MLIVIHPQSDLPVYRQVMEQVKLHIASGHLEPGDELPSTRALSAQLGVNPMTISKAYSYLEREQVLARRPGRRLVVKTFNVGQLQATKTDLLRQRLVPAVTVVRQLDLDQEEALRIFGDMLCDETAVPGP